MAIDYTNLNGSVNIGASPAGKRDTWNSYNFYYTVFYQRVVLLCGGNLDAAWRWWRTPLPYPPFLKNGAIRAPEELLTDDEWRSLRDWLGETVKGGWIDDVDFYNESQRFGTMTKQDNSLIQLVKADTGDTATTIQSRDGDYVIHTFTSTDQFYVRSEGIVEYLIVGGGGAGGGNFAGGGGGGGSVLTGFKRLTVGTYDIVIGAGGTGGLDTGTSGLQGQAGKRDGTDGGNTTAFGITAYGGGAGAGTTVNTFAAVARVKDAPQATPFTVDNRYALGSGGGGSAANTAGAVSTSHTKGSNGFGYRGGDGYQNGSISAPIYLGGGGGGAGGRGQDANVFPLSNVATTGTGGQFSCTSNPTALLRSGNTKNNDGTDLAQAYNNTQLVCVVTGTNTGTGTITGYANNSMYNVTAQTDGTFTLTAYPAGTAIVTTAGTLTGLTFVVTSRVAGQAGQGIYSTISDTNTLYGTGGAGGAHGALDVGNNGAGGGAASKNGNLSSSTTNAGSAYGSGGAGASGLVGVTGAPGGDGKQGIVIIRYPKNAAFGKKNPGNVAMYNQQLSG
ncbi:hypothetical protein UFOVP240_63 [uncultured Caudovirales phage]|uniref:Glycine-rich domain-containing protein n=1 Tax=uncultured Caudovirales phage TaxID=2100421 RepID=A0A6J7WTB8_9CAUD|nr:hypothetical protein UFOVP240_63 [uncultured Caudovirales phage]